MPRYVDWVRSGDIVPNQTIERLVDTPVIAVLDGRFGFGQTVAPQAVDIGVEKAKAAGLSAVSLRNAGHVGRVGEWAERAAAAGLISIHFVNAAGSVLVAPFGGARAAAFDRAVLRRHSARGRRRRSCSTSRPRWSPKARSMSRAAAASRCRRTR